jgi:hypothetical protein
MLRTALACRATLVLSNLFRVCISQLVAKLRGSSPIKANSPDQPGFLNTLGDLFLDSRGRLLLSLSPLESFVGEFVVPYQSTSLKLSLRARAACRPPFSAREREGL